jgi:hypothetical protein
VGAIPLTSARERRPGLFVTILKRGRPAVARLKTVAYGCHRLLTGELEYGDSDLTGLRITQRLDYVAPLGFNWGAGAGSPRI